MILKNSDLKHLFKTWSNLMSSEKEKLIELDSVVGDGDLGLTMSDGFLAAYKEIENSDEEDVGKFFYLAGKKMATAVPSTMGTLMASGFINIGKNFRNIKEINNENISIFFKSFYDGVKERGKAELGDKTFLDGFYLGMESFNDLAQKSMYECAEDGYEKSLIGLENTKKMIAKHGRAAIRGDSFLGHVDPGAYVATLLFKGYFEFIKNL